MNDRALIMCVCGSVWLTVIGCGPCVCLAVQDEARREFLDAGADYVLQKPVSYLHILEVLSEVLGGRDQAHA